MSKERPDHHDAELVLRLYALRRETVMRQSRDAIANEFWPKTFEDVVEVTKPDHHLNAPYRQVASYWEMVYGMVRHGIVHPEYFVESSGEGMYLYAKIAPHLSALRQNIAPLAFTSAEFVATETAAGRRLFELFTARVQRRLAAR